MGVDVIDFTELAKRKIIRAPVQVPSVGKSVGGFLDLSSSSSSNGNVQPTSPAQSALNPSPSMDFFESIAKASSEPSYPSSNVSGNSDLNALSLKMDTLTNKIEDTMYKIETLISRVMQLEARFDSR